MNANEHDDLRQSPPIPAIPPAAVRAKALPWWSPRPLSRLEALGDILILGIVLATPHLVEAVVAGDDAQVVRLPSPQALVAANALMSATAAALAIYLTLKSRQPLSGIGLYRGKLGREVLLALPVTILMFAGVMATATGGAIVTGADLETMSGPARSILSVFGRPTWGVILALAGSAAVFEEIVFRGFLLTRLRILLGHWPAAIAVGVVLFALPHLWEGWWGVILVLPVGLILSVTFVARRSLVAPMAAHFLFNCIQLGLLRIASSDEEFMNWLQST